MPHVLEHLGVLGTTLEPTTAANTAATAALLDLATAAIAVPAPGLAAAIRLAYGPGTAAMWFTGEQASPNAAAFHNAWMAARLDLDDGHRLARGHPGAAVIPAVLAETDRMAAAGATITDQAILRAIVVGYEIGLRIASARGFYARTGFWAGFAAAAAAGSLRGLSSTALAHALAIGGETGPHMATTTAGPAWPQPNGSDVKEGIAWGVSGGLAAVVLAEAGVTGALDLVDHAPFFDSEAILRHRPAPAICEIYTKFYAACRHCHAPIDAFLDVANANTISVDEIETIVVRAYSGALRIANSPAPRNLIDAQYSIPYCLGLAATLGPKALLPMTEASLGNAKAEAIARRVRVTIDPTCEARFPKQTMVRVEIRARGTDYISAMTSPRGEADNLPTWEQRLAKFRDVTATCLTVSRRDQWLAAFADLKVGKLSSMRRLLADPTANA